MNSIKLVFVMFSIITMLCSCNSIDTDTTSVESVTSDTLQEDVVDETTENHAFNTTEDKISYYKYYGNYLYDFDLDGVFEIIDFDYSGLLGELCICKIVDGKSNYFESIPYEHGWLERFTLPELTLYYDEPNDEYFYVNEHDFGFKYGVTAEINKYVFTDDEVIVTNIACCELVGIDEQRVEFVLNKLLGEDTTPIGILNRSEIVRYYDGVEEYLSQFEKIKEITYEELTAVSIEDAINSGTLADYLP